MIEISEEIFRRWSELSARHTKPSISLLLSSSLGPASARETVDRAVADAVATLEAEWEIRHAEDPGVALGVGGITVVAVPAGVLLEFGGGMEDFDRLLQAILTGLEADGIEGRFDVFEPEPVATLPRLLPLVECRLRILGRRAHLQGHHYRWHPDPKAWASAIQLGARWCREAGGQISLGVSALPRTPLDAEDDLAPLLLDAAERTVTSVVDCLSGSSNRWRMIAIDRFNYRISLIEAGEAIQPSGWRQCVDDLRGFLERNGQLFLYAFIKHGYEVIASRLGTSLADDWPQRAGFYAPYNHEKEFEDSYAPDAFALQLLGPGYAGRIPQGKDWLATSLGNDRVLLEHVRPEDWFATHFRPRDQPEVLLAARADFAEILFNDQLAAGSE